MDADKFERDRALGERVAHLEARLDRLEEAAGIEPETRAHGAAPRLSAPAVEPATTISGRRLRPYRPRLHQAGPMYWQAPGRPPPAPAHLVPETRLAMGPSGWAEPAPVSRAAWSIKLPAFSMSLNELEARLAGRALALVGGLALVLGAIFFLSLAFSRGWIGPELRVLIGLVGGAIGLAGGAVLMERGNRLLGHVLTPVGLAIVSISLIAATRLYALVPVEIGLIGALVSAIAAAVIAIRANSQIVAAFGLVTVLIAPPILGADPNFVTLSFVGVVLVGTTGIALWRSWSWLPPVAFALSVPQAAAWITGHPDPTVGLVGIGLYWLLNTVAAGGEEFRRHRDDPSASAATLLLANVAFAMWAGFVLLSGDFDDYRGSFFILVALAQLGVGAFFIIRDGERNLFGLLAIGAGISALTMAAPIQLGAPAVPIAWSAEAVALAWVAVRRGHPYSALVSGILYSLAAAYLVWLYSQPIVSTSGVPFLDGAGAALAFFGVAVAAGVWLVRDRALRSGLAALGLAIVASCVPIVLDEPSSVIALTILTVGGVAIWRVIPILPSAPIAWLVQGLIPRLVQSIGDWRSPAGAALPLTAVLIGLSATGLLIGPVYAPTRWLGPTGVPFVDPAGAAMAGYLVGLVAVAWISGLSRIREPLAAVGLLVTAWACLTEFDRVELVAAWATLMVLGLVLWRLLRVLANGPHLDIARGPSATLTLDLVLPCAALLSGAFAAITVLLIELPIGQFGRTVPPEIPFTDAGAVAAVILIVALLASGAVVGGALARRVSILVAGGVAAYAVPFEVYAWAVSVLWVGLGGLALVVIRVDRPGRPAYLIATASMVVLAGTVALGIVAPPSRLVVGSVAIAPIVLLQSIVSLGAVVAGLVAIARSARYEPLARWAWIAGGITVVYLLSVAVVGAVATQVGGSIATDELRTQGQVALSVLWAVLGLASFVSGLRLRSDDLRHGGLALLALATAKVFLFDLSELDVAYRVISLIALGILLLASAWLWQRFQPRSTPAGDHRGS